MTYLALDLGRSSVTAALWSQDGLVGSASAAFGASARDVWDGVVAAVGTLDPAGLVEVDAVGCAGTAAWFVVSREGEPLSPVLASVPEDLGDAYVASVRDFVSSLLTGRLATDPTAASASGLLTADGAAADPRADRLPPLRGSTEVLGDLMLPAARRLGLRSRVPVVVGATRETCAVEGAGAVAPLVTFGVAVHVPGSPPAPAPPEGVSLRAGGRSYQVYVAAVPGVPEGAEAAAAAAAPGSGAARVAYEEAAYAVARVVEALAPDAAFLYGTGATDRAWSVVLPAVTGLPVVHRRSDVTTCGLAMLTATGAGGHLDRERANPVAYVDEPDLDLAGRYAAAR